MRGNAPRAASGSIIVPSSRRGTSDDGGATPFVTHSSSKTRQARRYGAADMLFGVSWPSHAGSSTQRAMCGAPAKLYIRVVSGRSRSLPSLGSVCVVETWRTQ